MSKIKSISGARLEGGSFPGLQARELTQSFVTAENQLLLLLSRVRLSQVQCLQANRLKAAVSDWTVFFETAARNQSLPLVAKNLHQLGWPEGARSLQSEIQAAVAHQAVHNLKTISVLRKFVQSCIEPLSANYIVFKGITVAHRYYPDLGLRPCRDVDIAVEEQMLAPLIYKALHEGYQLFAPNGKGDAISSDRDVDALLRLARSAVLVSPEGVAIDLQPGIDKFSGIFADYDVFNELQTQQIGGMDVPVLKPEFLFNYICHHHSRHLWSRLHWLSDLDALLAAPELDLKSVRRLADHFGQRGTVEAAIEFHQLVGDPESWGGHELSRGRAFLDLCLQNLSGDLELEKSMAIHLIGGEFMFPWQVEKRLLTRARRNWMKSILAPSFYQYQQLPVPRWLQWIYYPTRLLQLVSDFKKRGRGRPV